MLRDMWFSVQQLALCDWNGKYSSKTKSFIRELYKNQRVASKHPKRMSGVL